ncbi:MAG: TolC family protein [Candidatus Saccharicenans sp.]
MSFIIILCFMLSSWPQEQPAPPLTLTLEQAVELASQQNPSLLALAREIEAARGQTLVDSALPEAEVGLELAGLDFPGARQVEQEITLGVVQTIPFPGKLRLRAQAGRLVEAEARLRWQKARLLLAAEVRKVYFRCLFHQKTVEILLKNLDLLEEIQKNAMARYALAAVPYSDILRVRLEIARTRNDLLAARNDLKVGWQELALLLGLKGEHPLVLTSSLEQPPIDWKLEEWLARKKELSPSLQLARLRQEQAEVFGQLVLKNRWPNFSLGFFSPSKKLGATGLSFGLSYPLFSRKRLAGEKILAEAEKQKALFASQAAERFYESRSRQAAGSLVQSLEQVRIFEESLLGETEAVLEKALSDYRLGRLDSLNLMDLYRQSSLVRLEYYRALYLYQNALADLEIAGEDYE